MSSETNGVLNRVVQEGLEGWSFARTRRVDSGFYVSQAVEARRA